jgi:hypothetical protein
VNVMARMRSLRASTAMRDSGEGGTGASVRSVEALVHRAPSLEDTY